MPRKTIADHAIDVMREEDFFTVMWGDGMLTTIGSRAGTKQKHPLDRMTAVISALVKDKRFEAGHIHGHCSRGNARVVRSATLKEEFR
jgi:formylmethanofuran dehydrogenase subunit B